MSEQVSNIRVEQGTERSFGIVFSVIFIIIGIYPTIIGDSIRIWAIGASAVIAVFAFILPRVYVFPNKLWFKFGIFLGGLVAPVVMAFVYFSTIFPIGVGFKLLGKDPLDRKLDKKSISYWVERDQPVGSMREQF